jgi:hypothetical protein
VGYSARSIRSGLALVGLTVPLAGCAFDSPFAVHFAPGSPTVTASFRPHVEPSRIEGVTARRGQIVRIDCSISADYEIHEATGTAFLVQHYVLHLRTRPLVPGTPYALDCDGRLLLEVPSDASAVTALATNASGQQTPLPVQAPVRSVRLAFGRHLRPDPRTQLVLVRWPHELTAGDYRVELGFDLARPRAIKVKAIYAASISCGRSRYLQPVLPLVEKIGRVPAVAIRPAPGAIDVSAPRLATGISSYAEARRTLSCVGL